MAFTESRLREALHEAATEPVSGIDFAVLTRRRRHRRVVAGTTLGIAATAVAGALTWTIAAGNQSAGVATVVPATPTVKPSAAGYVVTEVTRELDIGGGYFLEPATPAQNADRLPLETVLATDQNRRFLNQYSQEATPRILFGVVRGPAYLPSEASKHLSFPFGEAPAYLVIYTNVPLDMPRLGSRGRLMLAIDASTGKALFEGGDSEMPNS